MPIDPRKSLSIDSAARQRVRLDPNVRRKQIVEEATRLITHAGFNAISLADVADACGVRKSTILHYFPSMKDLLFGVILRREARDFDESIVVALDSMDARAARAAVTAKIEDNLTKREMIRLFYVLAAEALSTEHPAHAHFRDRLHRARQEIARMLSWKADPATSATELLAFWQGLELVWLADPSADILMLWHRFADRFFGSAF